MGIDQNERNAITSRAIIITLDHYNTIGPLLQYSGSCLWAQSHTFRLACLPLQGTLFFDLIRAQVLYLQLQSPASDDDACGNGSGAQYRLFTFNLRQVRARAHNDVTRL